MPWTFIFITPMIILYLVLMECVGGHYVADSQCVSQANTAASETATNYINFGRHAVGVLLNPSLLTM